MFKSLNSVLLMTLLSWYMTANADIFDGEELRDPTRPLFINQPDEADPGSSQVNRSVTPASYEVTFVRAGNTNPVAVVNDQRVTLGDQIDGARVVGIDRNSVTLAVNNEERRISVVRTNVKSEVIDR